MSMIDSMRRRIARRTLRRAAYRPGVGVGVADLEALGLAPLETVIATTAPPVETAHAVETALAVERRRRQEVGPQTGSVIMRRRASDWAPSSAESGDAPDEHVERRLA